MVHRGVCAVPVTEPTKVVAANLRHPIRVSNLVHYYSLITDGGEFSAGTPPDLYDRHGAPTALSSELAAGSLVRVSVSDDGVMVAVQLIEPIYDDPFARCSHGFYPWRMEKPLFCRGFLSLIAVPLLAC